MQPKNLEDVAIVIRPEKDNVAVVTVDFLDKGTALKYCGETFTISGRVLRGQSFAMKPIDRRAMARIPASPVRAQCGRTRRPHRAGVTAGAPRGSCHGTES